MKKVLFIVISLIITQLANAQAPPKPFKTLDDKVQWIYSWNETRLQNFKIEVIRDITNRVEISSKEKVILITRFIKALKFLNVPFRLSKDAVSNITSLCAALDLITYNDYTHNVIDFNLLIVKLRSTHRACMKNLDALDKQPKAI